MGRRDGQEGWAGGMGRRDGQEGWAGGMGRRQDRWKEGTDRDRDGQEAAKDG